MPSKVPRQMLRVPRLRESSKCVREAQKWALRQPGESISWPGRAYPGNGLDRKSTRLNSSHRCISYAVFCLKKKKKKKKPAVTLLDLGLRPRPNDPDEGLATMAELKTLDDMAKRIVISGQGDKKKALEADAA